jgi:four helix bundle protein
MRDHKNLRAFQLIDSIALMIYKITANFPKTEIYGLTSQMRRAAVSAASNIVEGFTRRSQNDFVRFLEISYGSLKELQYQYELSNKLGYCEEKIFTECDQIITEAATVLNCLIQAVRKNKRPNN